MRFHRPGNQNFAVILLGLLALDVTGANSRARNCTKEIAAVARSSHIKRLHERRPSEIFGPALSPGNLPRLFLDRLTHWKDERLSAAKASENFGVISEYFASDLFGSSSANAL